MVRKRERKEKKKKKNEGSELSPPLRLLFNTATARGRERARLSKRKSDTGWSPLTKYKAVASEQTQYSAVFVCVFLWICLCNVQCTTELPINGARKFSLLLFLLHYLHCVQPLFSFNGGGQKYKNVTFLFYMLIHAQTDWAKHQQCHISDSLKQFKMFGDMNQRLNLTFTLILLLQSHIAFKT